MYEEYGRSFWDTSTWKKEKDKKIMLRLNLGIFVAGDGTGSGSCPMAGFGISSVEPSGSATRVS